MCYRNARCQPVGDLSHELPQLCSETLVCFHVTRDSQLSCLDSCGRLGESIREQTRTNVGRSRPAFRQSGAPSNPSLTRSARGVLLARVGTARPSGAAVAWPKPYGTASDPQSRSDAGRAGQVPGFRGTTGHVSRLPMTGSVPCKAFSGVRSSKISRTTATTATMTTARNNFETRRRTRTTVA